MPRKGRGVAQTLQEGAGMAFSIPVPLNKGMKHYGEVGNPRALLREVTSELDTLL